MSEKVLYNGTPSEEHKVVHHDLFVYPPKEIPKPALEPYFEKLNQIKQQLDAE